MKAISSAIIVLAGAVGILAAVNGRSTGRDTDVITFILCAAAFVAVCGLIAWVVEMTRKD